MKFERNKNSKKYFLCGLILVVVLTVTVTFIGSKANYRMTASIPLTEGKVISIPYDLNIVAMYIDGVEQSKETTMPGKGYVLTKDSYCYKGTDKNNKDTSVILETNKYGEHIISELSKSSKCILYFKRREATTSAAKYILSHITEVTHRKKGTFNQVISGETTGKIYADSDDDGVTYYYAGNPTDNWVEFGGYYWRIIRINGNGSIRMIYQGRTEDENGNKLEPQATGEETQIGTSTFNYLGDDNAYVGYMYGTTKSSSYETTHENKNDSEVKKSLDDWFINSNIKQGSNYFDKIDLNAGFCGDRQFNISDTQIDGTSGSIVPKPIVYASRIRLINGTPKYNCNIINDLYSYKNNNIYSLTKQGNKALDNPVGLITADEASYAGMVFSGASTTTNNYLYTNSTYWTITPARFNDLGAAVYAIYQSGYIDYGWRSHVALIKRGIRPVINIRSDVELTGDGTISNPYKVVM
ncbi:MAG: hypothetical protein NC483_02210 [Ruminococcus sp.]|nr:hypothetical protein [Ruminococcus sp.]